MNISSKSLTDATPDEALMLRAAKRDKRAFTVLVERHQAGVVNFFRRMGDYNDAEDLAQETFVRLFKYRKRYRPKAKFTTFLYLLARRAWIDHCRARERRTRLRDGAAEDMAVRRSTGSDAAGDMHARAEEALRGLSDEMRMVVTMSIYQGFKYREIAEVLEVPVGTVKTRMFHAMRKLKEAVSS